MRVVKKPFRKLGVVDLLHPKNAYRVVYEVPAYGYKYIAVQYGEAYGESGKTKLYECDRNGHVRNYTPLLEFEGDMTKNDVAISKYLNL